MGMTMTMQLILYGVLIAVLAVAGYYVAKTFSFNEWGGAGIGAAIGVVVSGAMWYSQGGMSQGYSDDGMIGF